MRPHRARFRGQGVFFAFQSWAGCITNMFGFDLRQAQPPASRWIAGGLFALQHVVCAIGARHSGTRFVCSVLAVHSTTRVKAKAAP
jgi:hypothetical protein